MPTKDLQERIALAKSMMKLRDRCGYVDERSGNASICKRPKNHEGDHDMESVAKTIPF